MHLPTPRWSRQTAGVAFFLVLSLATPLHASPAEDQAEAMKALPKGYLSPSQLPDSLALLPPPPAANSAAFARDEEISRAMARTSGSPRWQQAVSDTDLHFPQAIDHFACAAGFVPDPRTTPTLDRLLLKAMVDVGLSTYRAKNQYQRIRPFIAHNTASCTPKEEKMLSADGSYPSGHSALGWGWALILSEMVPDRADAILQRGRDFGQSRLVCNVHWASDVDAGRLMASATVARLHAEAAFRADLIAARSEIARARPPAPATCTSEANALRD